MSKGLKRFGLIVLVIVAVIVVAGLVLPREYTVERQIRIAAPPEAVHAYVGDLTQWEAWEPWVEADPTVVTTLGEKTSGVGASQSWTDASGGGSLVFTRCDPAEGVAYDLKFAEWDDTCSSSLIYQKEVDGDGTVVVWSMAGEVPIPIIGGYFARMMDGWVGPMFETGLEKLKSVVEQTTPSSPSGQEPSPAQDS